MISDLVKPAVTRIITPTAQALLRMGLSPNSVTVIGAIGLVGSAFLFYPNENFIWGTAAVSFFALSDLFDGTMARISQRGSSRWGGFLDSTIDRITDSAVLLALIFALDNQNDPLIPVAAVALLTGILVPYIRAKAESLDVECRGGLAERTERLIIVLLAIFLHGLGISYSLAVGIWLVAVLGAITSVQRVFIVRKALFL